MKKFSTFSHSMKQKKEKPWKTTAILFRELISAVTNVKNYRLQCRRVWATCNSALPFYVVLFSERLETLLYFTLSLYQSTQNENAFETVAVILYFSSSCCCCRYSPFVVLLVVFNFSLETFHTEQAIHILFARRASILPYFFYCTCNHFL